MTLNVDSKVWNARISQANTYGTKSDLQRIQIELLNLRQKLGEFIEQYLEDYDTVMSASESNSPLWRAYRQKHQAYGEVEQLMRNVEYFLKK
jgi:hypothetical protein